MNIFGIDIGALLVDPTSLIIAVVLACVAIFIGIPILDIIFKVIDDIIIEIDNRIIDKVPFKPLKDFFQNKLIERLNKRIKRYQSLINIISD